MCISDLGIFSKPPNPHADSHDLFPICLLFVFAVDDEEVRKVLIIIIIIITTTPTLVCQTEIYI
jgi:hypothetical protein